MLVVENLFKSYKKKEVLKGVNLSIADNSITALIGLNGAGKSTLLDIICGIKKQNSGFIKLDDKDISQKQNIMLTKYLIGYMPQNFSLFEDLTVEENLEYLSAVYKIKDNMRTKNMIQTCNLENFRNTLAKNLSGGYKQLLSLAGAIIHNPKIIIMDEPTSAMDPLFRKKFWNIVHEYNKSGATVFTTTHYIEEIIECDTLLCLSQGKIIHSTPVKGMFENGKFVSVDQILQNYVNKEKNE